MRIKFSSFFLVAVAAVAMMVHSGPAHAADLRSPPAKKCADGIAALIIKYKGGLSDRANDKYSTNTKQENNDIGKAIATCELIYGYNVIDGDYRFTDAERGNYDARDRGEMVRTPGYIQLMNAEAETQQALVKDNLINLFGMKGKETRAAMAQLAAQDYKCQLCINYKMKWRKVPLTILEEDTAAKQAAIDDAAKKKAAEEAAKKKAAEEFIAKMDAENAAYKAKEKADEEKAAEEAAKKKALADDAFAVFDIPADEARAAIKRAADDAVNKQLKNGGNIDTKQMNTQTYVDENGNKGTLWCNPGPCTLGSALRHGWISGAGTFLPEELVDAATKVLMTDSETSSSAIRSEIFNITLKTIKEAAETSADPKLKSAAAMTTEQIKSKQVANEKSQEAKSGNLVVVEEAPVVEAPVVEAPVEEAPVEEAPVEEAPVLEEPVVEAPVEEDHHHDDGTEAPVDEGTEAPVEEWDDDCLGMEQCNIPIEGVDF